MPPSKQRCRISKRCSAAPRAGLAPLHRSWSMVQGGKRNSQRVVHSNPGTIRGLENSDTLSRPDQVGAIENVKQRDSICHFADRRDLESSLRGKIDLHHVRQLFQIRKASAQAAAIDKIGTELPRLPSIGDPARGAVKRLVIEHDVVPGFVAQLVGLKGELTGRYTFAHV